MEDDCVNPKELIPQWYARRGFEYNKFTKDRFAFHRTQENVTLDQYRSRILHRVGQIVTKRLIVYLDLKYWINLRKVLLGQPVQPEYVSLYDLLIRETKRGAIICPLSYWVFVELLKQADLVTRKATSQLIDQLSDGVAFVPDSELLSQEVLHFIRKISPKYQNTPQWPVRECIWTRTASFLGDRIPVWPTEDIPEQDQLLVQKSYEDNDFFVPLEHIVDVFSRFPTQDMKPGYNVEEINNRKRDVRKQHNTFESLFLAELVHTVKENEANWAEVIAYLYYLESGIEVDFKKEPIPEEERRVARNLFYYLFKLNKITDELPSYHIPAALFAITCWNDTKLLTKNDLYDFHHAQVAIPYCDFFLTESSLKSTVCSNLLSLDRIYSTTIIADPNEALVELQQSLQSNPRTSQPSVISLLFPK